MCPLKLCAPSPHLLDSGAGTAGSANIFKQGSHKLTILKNLGLFQNLFSKCFKDPFIQYQAFKVLLHS